MDRGRGVRVPGGGDHDVVGVRFRPSDEHRDECLLDDGDRDTPDVGGARLVSHAWAGGSRPSAAPNP